MSYANSSVVGPDTYWFSIPDPHINIGFKIFKKIIDNTTLDSDPNSLYLDPRNWQRAASKNLL